MSGVVSIYGLIDPRTGAVRYVGKAYDAAKRLQTHVRDSRRRNSPVHCWIRKLAESGLRPQIKVLETVAGDWREVERRLRAEYRAAGKLLNVADGGDEPHCSHEVRAANAAKLNARRASDPVFEGLRRLFQRIGCEVHYLERAGKPERADRMRLALDRVKALARRDPDWTYKAALAQSSLACAMR